MSSKKAKKERKEKREEEAEKTGGTPWQQKMIKGIKPNVLKPFGPSIGLFKLPPEFVQRMIRITDQVLEDKDRVDWGTNLVGQIAEEPWISNQVLKDEECYEVFMGCLHSYVYNSLAQMGTETEQVNVHLDHMWVVSQYEDEYNPVHYHTYCDLSAVMYLKSPNLEDSSKGGKLPAYIAQRDGQIELIYKSGDANALERGTFGMAPEPGTLLIFPSNLLHTVYPFKGPDERRSVAFNSHWQAVTKDGKVIDKGFRQPSDQDHPEAKARYKSKHVESHFAESKRK